MSDDRVTSAAWGTGGTPEASVLIPTHERSRYLNELCEALESQVFDRNRFEVIVVDDASSDDTWDILRAVARRTPLRMLAARMRANAGPAAARNIAASLARGPVLAFTDDDCLPTPGWLSAIVAGSRDADVVQGRTLPVPAEQHAAGAWSRSVWITDLTYLFETCNLAWRRAAFDRAGGFHAERPDAPSGTRTHFGEDAELGWRLLTSGGQAVYRPGALVHHRVHDGSFADWLAERRRLRLFPRLVRRAPGLGRKLRLGVFLSADTALFDLALAGVVAGLALRDVRPVAAAIPWLLRRWPHTRDRPGRPRPVRLAQLAVGDVVGFASLVEGSVRAGRPVL